MAKTGKFFHYPFNTTPVTGVGTSYNLSKKHDLTLWQIRDRDFEFNGFFESLLFSVSNITGGGAKMTVRICIDDDGQYSAVGDFEVPIDLGLTDPTAGTCQAILGIPFKNILSKSLGAHANEAHVFYKIDAGTCDVDVCEIVWSE